MSITCQDLLRKQQRDLARRDAFQPAKSAFTANCEALVREAEAPNFSWSFSLTIPARLLAPLVAPLRLLNTCPPAGLAQGTLGITMLILTESSMSTPRPFMADRYFDLARWCGD